jgi:2-(1,2-epoxy-1,2-dihydrophenyl)acetyl-CoA isomerase
MTAQNAEASVLLDINDGIATIRFNRPAALNAVDIEMACLLRDIVASVVANPAVRVIVLCGSGRAFVAGGDIGYFRAAGENAPQAVSKLIDPMHEATELLINASQPVIGSLHGAVAGAGMSLATAVDLVIAADNTTFNLAYIKIGNSPDCGASWTLPRVVGLRKAMEIALLGESIDAVEAHRIGLINRLVPLDKLAEETEKLARKLARSSPLGLAATKRLLHAGQQSALHDQLNREKESFVRNAGTQDFREALDAFFEKRPPKFQGN